MVRSHADHIEIITVGGHVHLVFSRYRIPPDRDRDMDTGVVEVEQEVMADISVSTQAFETIVTSAAMAYNEAKKRRSEIDNDVEPDIGE